jgi:molybdopterin molybdotransferase
LGAEAQIHSLDEAIAKVNSYCQSLPADRIPLAQALGRILREDIYATEDSPAFDCSTRDGFAILAEDASESFRVVDTIHAGDWRPRQLQLGETARVATGAPLPCAGLRIVMQENVLRNSDVIHIMKRENALNLRRRGEEVKIGQKLISSGARLDAGRLALLASAGHTTPLVSPRLRVMHFTTGDEIVLPDQMPRPGQIRDSNSILIYSLLQSWKCEVLQMHLPENFSQAKLEIEKRRSEIDRADLVLVSGGASVGDKDFTKPLLEWLGFKTIFSQVNIRPGKPLIFGVNGLRKAFGLPGNPLSHFACFHTVVTTAVAGLVGATPSGFLRGKLAEELTEPPSARETLWPARLEFSAEGIRLHPLSWASSGDITSLATANALLRIPVNQGSISVGSEVEFLLISSVRL